MRLYSTPVVIRSRVSYFQPFTLNRFNTDALSLSSRSKLPSNKSSRGKAEAQDCRPDFRRQSS